MVQYGGPDVSKEDHNGNKLRGMTSLSITIAKATEIASALSVLRPLYLLHPCTPALPSTSSSLLSSEAAMIPDTDGIIYMLGTGPASVIPAVS